MPRAIALIGTQEIHDLVLATSVATAFAYVRPKLMDVARFWRGSVARALAANALGRFANVPNARRVFTEGLLSDIGHMVLYRNVPSLAARARERAEARSVLLAEAERETIGCDYAEVGAELAALWTLPPCFSASIRYQTDPASASDFALDAALLHVAGIIAEALEAGADLTSYQPLIAAEAWTLSELGPECLPAILEETAENLGATLRMFSVGAA